MIDHKISTTSTNDDARSDRYGHFDVVWAERQSAGRGQRGHTWLSDEGLNLTFSVVLTPRFLPITEQFLISEVVALALVDTLREYGIECRIKWTNDIYALNSKIVGVLIEHALAGNSLMRTIVGIGINVNQRTFAAELPNPASMASLTGKEFDHDGRLVDTLTYKGEGWGITTDGQTLYMSDGTSTIRRVNPETMATESSIFVTLDGHPLDLLNELEWIDGKIWANVYMTYSIVVIDPATGVVEAYIDLPQLDNSKHNPKADVLNGIAYDSATGRIFITGKNWDKLYQIEITK